MWTRLPYRKAWAVWISLALSVPTLVGIAPGLQGAVSAPDLGGLPVPLLPAGLFHPLGSPCPGHLQGGYPEAGVFNVTAAGTGVWATTDLSTLANNSGVNTTLTVPKASLSTNQFVLLGIGDPTNSTALVAVGVAETGVPFLGTVATPVAYLPNGSQVYSLSGPFLTLGGRYTFAAVHSHGTWWNLTYNGNPIRGSAAWENGTYNFGVTSAVGVTCTFGARATPSFVAALYANGTSLPTLPTTLVPRAIGVAPGSSSGTTYVPASGNALPQLDPSLGTVYLEGSVQNSSLPDGAIEIGSSSTLGYPGANASLWGSYAVRSIGSLTVSPSEAGVAFSSVQGFAAQVTDDQGRALPSASVSWQLVPSSIGSLNSSSGDAVTFTAAASAASGTLWVNATYNCSVRSTRANLTVSANGGPAILSFSADPPGVVVGEGTNLTVVNGSWPTPVTYQYVGLPAPCLSANASRLACVPSETGSFPVTVFLNGSAGASSFAVTSLSVYPALALTGFSATPNPVTAGRGVTFAVQASGGVPPLTFNYTGLPAGCPSGPGAPLFTCHPDASAAGAYVVHVEVEDSAGHAGATELTLSVMQAALPLAIGGFAADPNPVKVGATTMITVNSSGGAAPLSYAYSGLPSGCASANRTPLACAPNSSGIYTVTVRLSDGSGRVAYANLTLQVVPSTSSPTGTTLSFNAALLPFVAGLLVAIGVGYLALRRRGRPRGPPPT